MHINSSSKAYSNNLSLVVSYVLLLVLTGFVFQQFFKHSIVNTIASSSYSESCYSDSGSSFIYSCSGDFNVYKNSVNNSLEIRNSIELAVDNFGVDPSYPYGYSVEFPSSSCTVIIRNPWNGSVLDTSNGNINYTPNLDYLGTDTFYTSFLLLAKNPGLPDIDLGCRTFQANINVLEAPIQPLQLSLSKNKLDSEIFVGDEVTVSLVIQNPNLVITNNILATVQLDPARFTIIPNSGFFQVGSATGRTVVDNGLDLITLNLPNMGSGESVTVVFNVRAVSIGEGFVTASGSIDCGVLSNASLPITPQGSTNSPVIPIVQPILPRTGGNEISFSVLSPIFLLATFIIIHFFEKNQTDS